MSKQQLLDILGPRLLEIERHLSKLRDPIIGIYVRNADESCYMEDGNIAEVEIWNKGAACHTGRSMLSIENAQPVDITNVPLFEAFLGTNPEYKEKYAGITPVYECSIRAFGTNDKVTLVRTVLDPSIENEYPGFCKDFVAFLNRATYGIEVLMSSGVYDLKCFPLNGKIPDNQ